MIRLKLIWLLSLFLLAKVCFSQDQYDFIEVRYKNTRDFGITSIKLLREGLVLRRLVQKKEEIVLDKHDNLKEKIKFYPIYPTNKVSRKKMRILLKYLSEIKIFEFDKSSMPEAPFFPHQAQWLSFINPSENKYISIAYDYCDPRIDKILVLINELIPKRDRKLFRTSPICKSEERINESE